jgi:hypothetical protein
MDIIELSRQVGPVLKILKEAGLQLRKTKNVPRTAGLSPVLVLLTELSRRGLSIRLEDKPIKKEE